MASTWSSPNPYLSKLDKFMLVLADGQSAGQLDIKDTQAWGLGPLFRRRGGEPGDLFQIIFDVKQRLAVAQLGEIEDEDHR